MKRFTTLTLSFVFAAIFAVSAFGQAGASKIGWIDTGKFADEKEGVTKYNAALKSLDAELKPRVAKLQALQVKIQNIAKEIQTAQQNTAVPINQQTILAKQEEGQSLQRQFEFEKKEYDAVLETRSGQVLGPVSGDISKAIQEYGKQKGYSVVFDIAALANANAILMLDAASDITKEFITFYNARPPATATAATPK